MNWKDAPADTSKLWLNKSLEIQLLLACNWSCIACDQHSNLRTVSFVRKGTMTLGQIDFFIREMKEANAYFGRIRLVGGEPTIAPRFAEIAERLHTELVKPGYIGRLEVVTNGSHPEKIQPVKVYLEKVRTSDERDKQRDHTANLIHSPASLGYQGKICSAPWHCGWSLNYWGFFPCSSGAGLSRFHDWERWQKVALPSGDTMKTWPDLQELCNHCYHALRPEHKIKCGTGQQPGQAELNKPSEANQKLLDEWTAGKLPTWAVYGAA